MNRTLIGAGLLAAATAYTPAHAQGEAMVTYRMLSPETALEVAQATQQSCRDAGYQVAVAVVDRMGIAQVTLRDRFAGPHTPDTAWRKAWTAVSFRSDTQSLSDRIGAGQMPSSLQDITNALMLGGGVPIEAGGSIVGAVGVSGAPAGDLDDKCARAGIATVQDRLNM